MSYSPYDAEMCEDGVKHIGGSNPPPNRSYFCDVLYPFKYDEGKSGKNGLIVMLVRWKSEIAV